MSFCRVLDLRPISFSRTTIEILVDGRERNRADAKNIRERKLPSVGP